MLYMYMYSHADQWTCVFLSENKQLHVWYGIVQYCYNYFR